MGARYLLGILRSFFGFTVRALTVSPGPDSFICPEIQHCDIRRIYYKEGLADPEHGNASLILYSLSLEGQQPQPFNGSLKEALLGATEKDLARLIRLSN
jgi:hypothetical protein